MRRGFLRIHPLLWLIPLAALASGHGQDMCITAAALAVHECGHMLCARALKSPIDSLCVTPLGGALSLNAAMPPLHEALIALAGPLANLLCISIAATLCQFGLVSVRQVYYFISANSALALLNLLPAAPLDGGRVLHALLSTWLAPGRAARISAILGIVLAFGVMVLVILGALQGYVYITLAAGAICIYLLAARELRANVRSAWQTHWLHADTLAGGACLPIRELAVNAEASLTELMAALRPGRITRFNVLDTNLCQLGTLDEYSLMDGSMSGASTARECIERLRLAATKRA